MSIPIFTSQLEKAREATDLANMCAAKAAFLERCPHLKIIFDFFHIKKNFNDKVIAEVRKEEQKRLIEEGRTKEAAALKKAKQAFFKQRNAGTQRCGGGCRKAGIQVR